MSNYEQLQNETGFSQGEVVNSGGDIYCITGAWYSKETHRWFFRLENYHAQIIVLKEKIEKKKIEMEKEGEESKRARC